MPVFRYTALSTDGQREEGSLIADAVPHARRLLKERGLFALELAAESAQQGLAGGGSVRRRWRGAAEIPELVRELAVLLEAGLPVDEALDACREAVEHPELRTALVTMRERLRSGVLLSVALRESGIFPPLMPTLVAVGETRGTLARVMTGLADSLERQREFRQRLLGAALYPALVFLFGLSAAGFLFTFILPSIEGLFTESGLPLPWITLVLLGIHRLLLGPVGVVLLLAMVGGGVAAWSLRRQDRQRWDALLVGFPGLGPLLAAGAVARFVQALALLVEGGTPLVEALRTALPTLGNLALQERWSDLPQKLEQGHSLAAALRGREHLPGMVVRFIDLGERAGRLGEMLRSASTLLESTLLRRWETLATVLQPLLVIGIGVFIGLIALSVFLPLLEMSSAL